MIDTTKAHPPVVDRAIWEAKRAELLPAEKEVTHLLDRVAAQRRRLPMTEVPNYTFVGQDGPLTFMDLFAGRSQLIVHHFMFQPEWDAGCPFCSDDADNAIPHLSHFGPYDINLVRISRAPIEKLLAYSGRMGWSVPWYSAHDNTFNQDWGWTNEKDQDKSGFSVYLQLNGKPYLTYSLQARGVEILSSISVHLDITPYGRQEQWKDVPAGWPQDDTFSKTKRHDEYESQDPAGQKSACVH